MVDLGPEVIAENLWRLSTEAPAPAKTHEAAKAQCEALVKWIVSAQEILQTKKRTPEEDECLPDSAEPS